MDLLTPGLAIVSLVVFVQALFALYLMLYAWEHPERLEPNRGPREFLPPRTSFTALLPARGEERVIFDTVLRVRDALYPAELLEIVVICHEEDHATINEVKRAIDHLGPLSVRLALFGGATVNKPRALNVGLAASRHDVVTVFDAEDDIDPDIFNVVNTVMVQEDVGIVQAGVQLMNMNDRWFSVHNCLEYFFWFKSRLHFHARAGMIPLGGNTVFVRRALVLKVGGWDEACLTEDADIGLRLSTLGERIRVVYDPAHVTREETPLDVPALIRQRTRWHQGFLQVLRKGSWVDLPGRRQRLLALYTFSFPIIQLPLTLLWPLALAAAIFLKVPLLVAMISFLPLYALLFQLLITIAGALMFGREYGLRTSPLLIARLVVTFVPYQAVLAWSSARAVLREFEGEVDWEKTEHAGAHRRGRPTLPSTAVPSHAGGAGALGLQLRQTIGLASAELPVRESPIAQATCQCGAHASDAARFCRRCGALRTDNRKRRSRQRRAR